LIVYGSSADPHHDSAEQPALAARAALGADRWLYILQ
jgi:hypothetical protein